jgi:hypothetical protein
MEAAAARRTLRKGKKLPSLVSLHFNQSVQLGETKEAQRQRRQEAAVAAAALAAQVGARVAGEWSE